MGCHMHDGTATPTYVPIWEKYSLTVEEASAYFRIGENKIRKILADNADADYVLWNGSRPQIKRVKFEHYLDRLGSI